jgi:hypothetical protein
MMVDRRDTCQGSADMIDADQRTLHIRCGSDIRDALRTAGFSGDFLEYADPICEGPVPDVPDLLALRARYLAAGKGPHLGFTEAQCLTRMREAEQRVSQAHRYDRVVLWFEHDPHDQLVLARCLSLLAEGPLPECLELICIDHHPDVARFIGLGQLSPSALAGLWPARTPVTTSQIRLYRAIWAALREPDPTGIHAIARAGTPAQPIAAPALWRHLRELPGTTDGLSLTQRIMLSILSEAPARLGKALGAIIGGREPLVFLGDIGLLATIEAMANTTPPALTIQPGQRPFDRLAMITDTGRRVLGGTMDFLSLRPEQRWVGGVIADGRWRWDDAADQVIPGQPY